MGTSNLPVIHFYLASRLKAHGVLFPRPTYTFTARCLGTYTTFNLSRLAVQNVSSDIAGVGWTPAGREKTKEGREAKLLRGVCVQTAFHAEQTKLRPLFDFPSEFIRIVAGGSNAKQTAASFGEMRNTQRILFGEPDEEKAVGRTRRRCSCP